MNFSNGPLLLDCDILCYQFGFPHEESPHFEWVAKDIDGFIKRLKEKFGTEEMHGYLTGEGNYRKELSTTHKYKGTRTKPKPKWYEDIRQYLVYVYAAQVIHGMEADDALAAHMTRDPLAICCTIDKDLRTVSGWHYTWGSRVREEKPLEYIDDFGYIRLKENRKDVIGGGASLLYTQALLGDKVDNIIGLNGYGPVRAVESLEQCTTEWQLYNVVKHCYEEAGESYERLVENMNLLWMCRELKEGKPVLWQAPEEA